MKKVDFNSVVKLKLNKLNSFGLSNLDSDNCLEVEVEEMEKVMLQNQLSQRQQPMRMIKLKEKKVIENYIERVKAGTQKQHSIMNNQKTKETRATATSHSTQKEYINYNSQQFQLSNFHMQNTNSSFDNRMLSENTHNSTESNQGPSRHLSLKQNLYQLAQNKLQHNQTPYVSTDTSHYLGKVSRRRNGLENQNSFDDYQMKTSIRDSELFKERKGSNSKSSHNEYVVRSNQQALVNIEEQSESNNQLNSNITTKYVDDEDGNVKIENNQSMALETFRPQAYRIKKNIIREQPTLYTDRSTSLQSKKLSQYIQPQSTKQQQHFVIREEQEENKQVDINGMQKITPRRSHKRQALSLARGSRYQGPTSRKSNPYQSAEHQRPMRKIINTQSKELYQNEIIKEQNSILNSINEVVPTYSHRKSQSGVHQRVNKFARCPPGQLMEKFRSKLNAQQIQTPTSIIDSSQQTNVQLIMPQRKNVQSTQRGGSKAAEKLSLKSGRNKREYSYISNDLSQIQYTHREPTTNQVTNYPIEGFFDQRFSSKSNKYNKPEIIQTSRQYGTNFQQRVLSARDNSKSVCKTKQNLSVDYGRFVQQQQTRVSDLQLNDDPSDNVEEMHNMCVRFHRQLKTLEDGKRQNKLDNEANYKKIEYSTISSNVIELNEHFVIEDNK